MSDSEKQLHEALERDVNRSDAVLDWAEIHLAHYDWQTALACIDQLLAHLRASLLAEEPK